MFLFIGNVRITNPDISSSYKSLWQVVLAMTIMGLFSLYFLVNRMLWISTVVTVAGLGECVAYSEVYTHWQCIRCRVHLQFKERNCLSGTIFSCVCDLWVRPDFRLKGKSSFWQLMVPVDPDNICNVWSEARGPVFMHEYSIDPCYFSSALGS